MKKIVSMLLVLCICLCLAACGSSSSGKAAAATSQPAATEAPAAAEPLAATESVPASPAVAVPTVTEIPTSGQSELQSMVDSLNEEEAAQHTADDPSVGVFELGKEPNTIIYKLSMQYFEYVVMMAQAGDQEHINAYNRTVELLPPVEVNLENALRESMPDLNVVVYMMEDEYSPNVIAVVDDGEIIIDSVNGVGTAPTDVTPIIVVDELTPEEKEQIANAANAMMEAQAQPQG